MSGMGQTIRLVGESQRVLAKRLIDSAPPNAIVNIAAERRTPDQNALMWVLLSDVSRAKPDGRTHTPETWKQLFLHALGHAVRFEAGLNGEPFPVGFRSSRLSKKQMVDLVDFILAWGSEHGVRWSAPTERKAA